MSFNLDLKQVSRDSYQDHNDLGPVTASVLENLKRSGDQLKATYLNKVRTPVGKRIFDIIISGIALIILSPIFIIVAGLLKLESRAPVFFVSKRVGLGYTIFDLIKFRSMIPGAENKLSDLSKLNIYVTEDENINICSNCRKLNKSCDGIKLFTGTAIVCESLHLEQKRNLNNFTKLKNDPRVTSLGKFLRRRSIDELPQLINIFKGDMSLVGNRPLPLYEAEKLTTDIYSKRFLAPAGLTGLWQVSKFGKNPLTEQQRMELDNKYADEYSMLIDLKIIIKTIPAMLFNN